ncbi:MAG: hypothetical protein AB7I37_17450 [Pirellulales bacterium]
MSSGTLRDRIGTTAFAFRGYNITNQGRSHELLAVPAYEKTLQELLGEASQLCAAAVKRPVDLVQRVREQHPTSLETFPEDVAVIVAVELAQIRLLHDFFDIDYSRSKLAFGYSLGEMAALAAAGVYRMQDVLTPLLAMSMECAELARDVSMGVVFSRGPALDRDAIGRLCVELNREGAGVIGISAYLSPNTVLLLGQRDTVERFKRRMHEVLPDEVHLRTNQYHWPPLHTPILWERNIPNRAAMMMHTIRRGLTAPLPPVLSLVTGKCSYNDYNSRDLLNRWIDEPQRLWDAIAESLVVGVDTYIHVGPEANLIPATFKRLADNIEQQLAGRSFSSYGMRAAAGMAQRPWLAKVLSNRTALLRAPYVEHIMLEDWLLENAPK